MINKKSVLIYAKLCAAFLIIGATLFLATKNGGFFWPYSQATRGIVAGVVVCLLFSKFRKSELTFSSLLKWGLPFGFLGAFWCCVQLDPNDHLKIILDTLAMVFGAVTFLTLVVSFSVLQLNSLTSKKK